jgi:hypothetical protein
MAIEIRLKKILQESNMDNKGILKKISKDLKLHRHSVGKFYRNQMSHPSLDILDQICNWLIDHGVPKHKLPQGLFGFQAMDLWVAIADSGEVTFYLGEYQQEVGAPTHGQRWISRRDSETAGCLVNHLTTISSSKKSSPQLNTRYVAFRSLSENKREQNKVLLQDMHSSTELFQRVHSQKPHETTILIGSQRVNYLVENFVAELFRCQPFKPGDVDLIPFYLKYRSTDVAAPSCFGGEGGLKSFEQPGIYYLTSTQGWIGCPWILREQDSGIVIVQRNPGNESLMISIFGFSGRATVVIGRYLSEHADKFWPPTARTQDKEVGVYICRLEYSAIKNNDDSIEPEAKIFEAIPIEKTILEERLR